MSIESRSGGRRYRSRLSNELSGIPDQFGMLELLDFAEHASHLLQRLGRDARLSLDAMSLRGVGALQLVGHVERLESDGLHPRIRGGAEAEVVGMDREELLVAQATRVEQL